MQDEVIIENITDGEVSVIAFDSVNMEQLYYVGVMSRIEAMHDYDVIGEIIEGEIKLFEENEDYEEDYSEFYSDDLLDEEEF
ncbi:hypothetical protein [Oceanihabitans sediminis]|uniref:hypothetical protein n=1 Tax=Oceanihabitans sediminis TaxID=1812012 RepID=UPI00299D7B4B|nr:hypothetical protein [Oceanihabitans sediminis]MDX1279471.1 hypothetical protein [Oceanihabitans sediminis]